MLRFTSSSTLALALLALAACDQAIIANGNGGSGGTSATSTGSGTTSGTCGNPCSTPDTSQCVGNGVATCALVDGCLTWLILEKCGSGKTCNDAGTKCVSPPDTCTLDAECGCGCACADTGCVCEDQDKAPCDTDADCGDPCTQLRCLDKRCALPACIPGQDATCNDNPDWAFLTGHCNADATCTCDPGRTKQPDGRCG